jgi:hypothetical protein
VEQGLKNSNDGPHKMMLTHLTGFSGLGVYIALEKCIVIAAVAVALIVRELSLLLCYQSMRRTD